MHNRAFVGYQEFQRTLIVASIPTKGEELVICECVADGEITDFGFVNGKLSLLLVLAYFQLKGDEDTMHTTKGGIRTLLKMHSRIKAAFLAPVISTVTYRSESAVTTIKSLLRSDLSAAGVKVAWAEVGVFVSGTDTVGD